MSDTDWGKIANDYFAEQPHPQGHGLKIGEYATAIKLASMMKFGGHASGAEAALFWPQFQASGMSPDEFEHALDHIAPVAYTFHGRPPTMKELAMLKDKSPAEVHRHYGDLPSKHHPEITAANFVKAYQAARPWAQQHLGREPVHSEVAYMVHSNEDPRAYYPRISMQNTQQQGGPETQVGTDGGGGGVPPAGGQAAR